MSSRSHMLSAERWTRGRCQFSRGRGATWPLRAVLVVEEGWTLTEEDNMDALRLKARPELEPSLSDAIVGVIDDDLATLLLEEVERLLFEPVLDANPQLLRLLCLGSWRGGRSGDSQTSSARAPDLRDLTG